MYPHNVFQFSSLFSSTFPESFTKLPLASVVVVVVVVAVEVVAIVASSSMFILLFA